MVYWSSRRVITSPRLLGSGAFPAEKSFVSPLLWPPQHPIPPLLKKARYKNTPVMISGKTFSITCHLLSGISVRRSRTLSHWFLPSVPDTVQTSPSFWQASVPGIYWDRPQRPCGRPLRKTSSCAPRGPRPASSCRVPHPSRIRDR